MSAADAWVLPRLGLRRGGRVVPGGGRRGPAGTGAVGEGSPIEAGRLHLLQRLQTVLTCYGSAQVALSVQGQNHFCHTV